MHSPPSLANRRASDLPAPSSNSLRRPAPLAQALIVLVLYTSTAAYFVYALLYALALTDFMGAAASQIGNAARTGASDAARSVAAAKKWWSAANAAVLVNVSPRPLAGPTSRRSPGSLSCRA